MHFIQKSSQQHCLKMLARTTFLTFLFVLNCPSFLLIPLAKEDGVAATNANNSEVITNQMKEISSNKLKVPEVIQQIDVKDSENQVISHINQVILTDEVNEMVPRTVQNDDEEIIHNGTNNLVTNGNAVSNNTKKTNSLNISLPLLSTKSVNDTSGNTSKVDNATVPALQNRLANETRSNLLNTTNNVKVNNVTNMENKRVSTVPSGNTSNINRSSSLACNNTITSAGNGGDGRNGTNLNNSTTSNLKNNSDSLKNETTGAPTTEHTDGKKVLQETSNDSNAEISWRSDIPMKRKKLHSQSSSQKNGNFNTNNSNGSVNNNNSDFILLNLTNNSYVDNALKRNTSNEDQNSNNNDEAKDVFVIINTGNIDGLSINAPANDENVHVKAENNTIENLNPNNSKLLHDVVDTTINHVLANIQKESHSNLNSKHIFLILNSGNITNIHVKSPNFENNHKNVSLKDRLSRDLNDSNTNITKTLKPSNDKSYPIIDIKFRSGEKQHRVSNVDKDKQISTEPSNYNQSNSTPKYEAVDNATTDDSNSKAEIYPVQDKDIPNAEAPAFRSLIPDKRRKLQHVSNVSFRETNTNKSNNLSLNRMPESPPTFDFNPMANIFSGAFDFMTRFKRNSEVEAKTNLFKETNCRITQIDGQTVISCTKTIPTRKSLNYNVTNVLKLYDSVELVCPLSVFLKLFAHQVFDKLAENIPGDGILNKIVSSFVNDNDDKIDLASIELYNVPIPVALRLQIVHGKTKEYMVHLNNIVDASLCSLG